MPMITIDGNIGCGKTSVLNYLHKINKTSIDLEPVDNWLPYLKNMYIDKKNTFKFQVRIWLDRCWIQEKIDKPNILVERSPHFIKNVFIELAKNEMIIEEDEYNILLNLHDKTEELWNNNIYIYLRSNPELCLARIKKRNRVSENNITLEKIINIHNLHEKTYKNMLNKNVIFVINIEDKTLQTIANEIMKLINNLY
tara:strand:- start:4832 stop:5422 length:591 start_codon:yes stop_codon:yes gene_type:complete